MKLSEMNTVELAKCLCILAEPVERIARDEDVSRLLEGKENLTNLDIVTALIPALLERHLDDTITVIAAMSGKSAKTVREQSARETVADVKALLSEELIAFFTPPEHSGPTK